MLAPPFFNPEFADDDGTPLAGGFIHTYVSGTTTPLATYTDSTGNTENANPIELDAAGRCSLWLASDAVYTFVIKRADLTTVRTVDGISGCAAGSVVVTSVNSLTGAVSLTADDVPFTTGTATTWFAGVDISAALDSIITKVDNTSAEAASALVLANPRTIALSGAATGTATAFDGSTNIAIPVTALAATSLTGTIDAARLPAGVAQFTTSSNQDEVNLPLGSVIYVEDTNAIVRNGTASIYLSADTRLYTFTAGGTQLTGTWRNRGSTLVEGIVRGSTMQRVA